MGCASSKEVARKRAEKESWYAPVTRSVSAPIHYPAQNETDSCHVVSLASSSYGIMELEKPGDPIYKGSFVRILHDKHIIHEEKRLPVDFASYRFRRSCDRTLKPVEEVPEIETGGLETINTWELMEGLDEEGVKTPPPHVLVGGTRGLEKSVSFNTALDADSCFSEIGTPVLKKYYLNQEEEGQAKGLILPIKQTKLGMAHRSSLSFGGAEDKLCGDYAGLFDVGSPVKTQFKSAKPKPEARAESPPRSPCSSPAVSSTSTSPLMGSKNSSPLFDPSLMATFEQALQAVPLPEQGWALPEDHNEDSSTNSSASLSNNTWMSSETCSDAESPPQSELAAQQDVSEAFPSPRKKTESLKVYPQAETMKMNKHKCCLDSFELRCPPRGEEKVVLYFTSLRGIRKTFEDCCELRLILQGFGVHVDERDVWMHSKFREELTELLKSKRVQVPKLFVKGRYIGGADEVKRLNEDGVLAGLMDGLPNVGLFHKVCEGCADVRFIPCLTCSGSRKVLDSSDQIMQCDRCNENGLSMCPLCT